MLSVERENEIVAFVNKSGTATVRALAQLFGVTEATIRRDLQKLNENNLLQRTHGGAMSLNSTPNRPSHGLPVARGQPKDEQVDALILAPVQNRVAHTLRERALRSRIPLLAESVGFEGAIYLGPNNYRGAFALGCWAGEYLLERNRDQINVLDLTSSLANGKERSTGFTDGLNATLDSKPTVLSLDGHDVYNAAYQVARDALWLHPEINVLFGANDDLILAAIQAALDLGRDPKSFMAVNVGGEGTTIFDALEKGGPLKACLALFPEVVGRMGVDAIVRLWAGEDIGEQVITPSAVITAGNLAEYYTKTNQNWDINLPAAERLEQSRWTSPLPSAAYKRASFVIHFRTHEWYQNVARAMRERASQVGVSLAIQDVNEDLKAEINELRRLIGKRAATYINDGETIIMDSGTTTAHMAHFLDAHRQLTVITNSIPVFKHLSTNADCQLILTGGDFHRESQSLIGRGAKVCLQEIRADKVLLVAGGVSANFGLSSKNQQEAEVRRAMIDAAREVVVLADHTVIGIDSHCLVADLDKIDTIITDAGILSADRLAFNRRGIRVIVVNDVEELSGFKRG